MSERRLAPLFTWRSAICESDLKSTTRHVALTLSLYMNERGGSAHPGATRLAAETGLHIATVRACLAELVDGGWLEMLAQGGLRGAKRAANVYEARIPPNDDDPSSRTTHRPDGGDPSSSPRRPVVQDDPISSGTLQELIPPGDVPASLIREQQSVTTIVAGYVGDFRALHDGHAPSRRWRAIAGSKTREALEDGAQPGDVQHALAAIARENKSPAALAHVLADLYAERAAHPGTDSFFDALEPTR